MTKLRIMSDLHLEFGPLDLQPIGEDILVLAGDINLYAEGALWAQRYAHQHQIPTVMIAGNHEFYNHRTGPKHTINQTLDALRAIAERDPYFTFLEDDITTINNVTFVGATLWTDFNLNQDQPLAMYRAQQNMNDYYLIRDDTHTFTPKKALARHVFSAGILRERLPRNYDDNTPLVVMTHHLPSPRSLDGRYANSTLNAAYASNLEDLVAISNAAIWVHGHTHVSQDYQIGNTRILCNPRGYYGYELNPDFNPDLLVELP